MTNIRTLVESFTTQAIFKSTAKRLSKFDQAVLLGPATLVADIVSRNNDLMKKEKISICWLAPSGSELVDQSKWLAMAKDILKSEIEFDFTFVGVRKMHDFQGPNPHAAESLPSPDVQSYAASEAPDQIEADIIILGHSHDSLSFDEWKRKVISNTPQAKVYALSYSHADNVVERTKWESMGLSVVDSFFPEYAFDSKSEPGSRWSFQVDELSRPNCELEVWKAANTLGWLQKHSGEAGTLNPVLNPCSRIEKIQPLKTGKSFTGVYLVDDLVLIPKFQLLVKLDPSSGQIEVISSVAKQIVDSLPTEDRPFKERYEYCLNIKLAYVQLWYEKENFQFIGHLRDLVVAGIATRYECRQLAMHEHSESERQKLFRIAIGQGCSDSLVDLAQSVRKSSDDHEESIRMLKVASKNGSALADFNLSVYAQQGSELFESDDPLKHLSLAANAGLPEANYFLGMYYVNNQHIKWGVEHLERAAMFGLRDAAELIITVAQQQFISKEITKKHLSKIKRKYRQFKVVA